MHSHKSLTIEQRLELTLTTVMMFWDIDSNGSIEHSRQV